ncbi:MAG: hypothetical protein AAFY71_10085 [Bacteroidota bacterium]
MRRALLILLLTSITASSLFGQSKLMRQHLIAQKNKGASRAQFIKNFPYTQYLAQVEFTDFKTLQKDREYVYRFYGEGDIFLYTLGDHFNSLYPVGLPDLDAKIAIGELYLSDKRRSHGINNGKNEIYRIIGYFILGKVAQKIEEEIRHGNIKGSEPQIEKAIQRLRNNKIFVTMETGTLDKIIKNIQQGKYMYVVDRVFLKVSTYLGQTPAYIFFGLGALTLFFFLFKASRKLSLVFLGINLVFSLSCFALKKIQTSKDGSSLANGKTILRKPKYYLDNKYFLHKSGSEHRMVIFGIENEQGTEVGQSIWLGRPKVKANYFAYQNVPAKFQRFKRNRPVLVAATAGFTNSQRQPEGLTVEKGNIVNAVIMHDRHGLVVVENSGGLRVINLKRKEIKLPIGGGKSETIQNPLTSLVAYSRLLQWCRNRKATLFQTQLLAFGDQLLINVSKAPMTERERRILVGFRDKKSKKLYHSIFNIKQPHSLAIIAEEIFMMVGNRNMKIEFMLNLDVGSYDILNVFDERGRRLNDVKGPVSINQATNLIVWSK